MKARPLWVVFGTVFTVVTLAWGVFSAVNAFAYEKRKSHLSFDGPVDRVDIDSGTGSVKLIGSEIDRVEIDITRVRGIKAPRHHESLRDGDLRISSGCSNFAMSFCSVDYVVHVPPDVAATIDSSGGSVTVNGVFGDLDVSSSGGGVHVDGGRGAMTLRSSGGGVTAFNVVSEIVDASSSGGGVHLEFAKAPADVRATSSGGGVTVVLPKRWITDYNVEASSSGGGAHVDVASDPTGSQHIRVHSSGGGVTVRYPERS